MKLFRIGYNQVFLPKNDFLYKGKTIGSMSIVIKYKIFNIVDNTEYFFTDDEKEEIGFYFDKKEVHKVHIINFVTCNFSKEKIIDININHKYLNNIGYKLEYEIVKYSKDIVIYNKKIGEILEPETIDKEEFFEIIRGNISLFDNLDNYPTQNCSYMIFEVPVEDVNI